MNTRNDTIGVMDGGQRMETGNMTIDQINTMNRAEGALLGVWHLVKDAQSLGEDMGEIDAKEFDSCFAALQAVSDELLAFLKKHDPSQALGVENRAKYRRQLCSNEAPCRHCRKLSLKGIKVDTPDGHCPVEGRATVLLSGEIVERSGRFDSISGLDGSNIAENERELRRDLESLRNAVERDRPLFFSHQTGGIDRCWEMYVSLAENENGGVEAFKVIVAPSFE